MHEHLLVPVDGSELSGRAMTASIELARDQGCDLIVMITHGRGALAELMWGSHTKNLLSRCTVPLLVLH